MTSLIKIFNRFLKPFSMGPMVYCLWGVVLTGQVMAQGATLHRIYMAMETSQVPFSDKTPNVHFGNHIIHGLICPMDQRMDTDQNPFRNNLYVHQFPLKGKKGGKDSCQKIFGRSHVETRLIIEPKYYKEHPQEEVYQRFFNLFLGLTGLSYGTYSFLRDVLGTNQQNKALERALTTGGLITSAGISASLAFGAYREHVIAKQRKVLKKVTEYLTSMESITDLDMLNHPENMELYKIFTSQSLETNSNENRQVARAIYNKNYVRTINADHGISFTSHEIPVLKSLATDTQPTYKSISTTGGFF